MGLCVCVSLCLFVKPYLTSGASLRPEMDVTYSTGNEGQKVCGNFSETAPLCGDTPLPLLYVQSAILLLTLTHVINIWHCRAVAYL